MTVDRDLQARALAANAHRTSAGLVLAVRNACEYTLWNRRELGFPVDELDADLQAVVDSFDAVEASRQNGRSLPAVRGGMPSNQEVRQAAHLGVRGDE